MIEVTAKDAAVIDLDNDDDEPVVTDSYVLKAKVRCCPLTQKYHRLTMHFKGLPP